MWLLPAGGGEARMLAGPPGGVDAVAVSREDGAFVFAAGSHPDTAGWEKDAAREKASKDAGVGAQLFTGYPIRLWDHSWGPASATCTWPRGRRTTAWRGRVET